MGQDQALQGASAVVLVVHSNALKRAAKATDLQQQGFKVFEAADAAAAKAILDAMAVDVVISDIDLINGLALAQWLKQRQPAAELVWSLSLESDQPAYLH